MTTGESDSDNKSRLTSEASNPAGRYGADTDMAATILFLASKGGTYYNDQIMYPDGGKFADCEMHKDFADLCREHTRYACVQVIN